MTEGHFGCLFLVTKRTSDSSLKVRRCLIIVSENKGVGRWDLENLCWWIKNCGLGKKFLKRLSRVARLLLRFLMISTYWRLLFYDQNIGFLLRHILHIIL